MSRYERNKEPADPRVTVPPPIHHDEARGRFYINLGSSQAFLRYSRAGPRVLDFTSTYVPAQHRNRGLGAQIVRHALAYARTHGLEVIPTCSFVRWVLERENTTGRAKPGEDAP